MNPTLRPERTSVIFAIPTSPPYSGPEIVGDLMLRADMGPSFEVVHVRTNVHRQNAAKGRVNLVSLLALGRSWSRLVRAIQRARPPIVFLYLSQNWTGFVRDTVLICTARLMGASVIAQVHGANFANFYEHSPRWRRPIIRRVVRSLSSVLVLADRFRYQFEKLCPARRVGVLHNPIMAEAFEPRTGSNQALKAEDGCRILFMGHLSTAKGFVDLMNAVPLVFDACPDVRFDFSGEWLSFEENILHGERGEPIVHDAVAIAETWTTLQRRYPRQVRYRGVVNGNEKIALIQQSDALVLPSYSEGFPMAILEAMAAGLPVVVTPVGVLPEILLDSINALFVEPGDLDGLAEALVAIASRPDLRAAMGRANREIAASKFALQNIAQQLVAHFNEILVARQGTRSLTCSRFVARI
jgi:glycosyltransferase involved in cell wall biosynthesis